MGSNHNFDAMDIHKGKIMNLNVSSVVRTGSRPMPHESGWPVSVVWVRSWVHHGMRHHRVSHFVIDSRTPSVRSWAITGRWSTKPHTHSPHIPRLVGWPWHVASVHFPHLHHMLHIVRIERHHSGITSRVHGSVWASAQSVTRRCVGQLLTHLRQ